MVRELWFISTILAGAVALLVVELPSPTRNFGLFVNALHAPAFAVLTVVLLHWSLEFLPRAKAAVLTACTCLLVGLSGELLQVWGPRDADLTDLLNNAIGVAAGLCISWACETWRQVRSRADFLPAILTLLPFLLLTLAPATWYGFAAVAQQIAMPELVSFDKRWEASLYRASGDARFEIQPVPSDWPASGNHLVRIFSTGDRYPGIVIEPTKNWDQYETLTFYAASANNLDVRLTLTIKDGSNRLYSDRFNYSFSIVPDAQLITIELSNVKSAPQGREMNMATITELVIFIADAAGNEEFFLDEFRLAQ